MAGFTGATENDRAFFAILVIFVIAEMPNRHTVKMWKPDFTFRIGNTTGAKQRAPNCVIHIN